MELVFSLSCVNRAFYNIADTCYDIVESRMCWNQAKQDSCYAIDMNILYDRVCFTTNHDELHRRKNIQLGTRLISSIKSRTKSVLFY